MAINDVYMLTDIQSYGVKVMENVYFFESIDTPGNAGDLIEGFIATYLPAIRQLQAAGIYHTEIKCQSLGDLSDFDDVPMALSGLAGAGDTLPSFVAVGYSLKPDSRVVRPGSKRIGGILEAVVTNGVIVEPTFVTNVEALRIILDDNITATDSTYQHVIVKRVKESVVGTVPPAFTYRLPLTDAELVLAVVRQALSNLQVSSQVSRKS